MNGLGERETLNLMLPGGLVERFIVTKASWRKFLQGLFEQNFPELSASNPNAARDAEDFRRTAAAIPSQL